VNQAARIPEYQLKSLPQLDLSAKLNSRAADFKAIMSNTVLGQAQYDEAAHVVWVASQSDVVGAGTVLGLSGLIPTEKGFIQVNGYSTSSTFQNYVQTFRRIVASVSPAPDLAYKPNWVDSSRILSGIKWEQVGAKAIGGAIIGGLIALFAGLGRKKKQ